MSIIKVSVTNVAAVIDDPARVSTMVRQKDAPTTWFVIDKPIKSEMELSFAICKSEFVRIPLHKYNIEGGTQNLVTSGIEIGIRVAHAALDYDDFSDLLLVYYEEPSSQPSQDRYNVWLGFGFTNEEQR